MGRRRDWSRIGDIEALNAKRGAAYKILDHAWSEKRLEAAEQEAFANFSVVKDREQLSQPARGRGRSFEPKAPQGMADTSAPAVAPAEPTRNGDDVEMQAEVPATDATPKSKKADPIAKKPTLKIDKDGDDDVWEFN
ncbi:MAG: hypothetical protein MRY81_24860 [Donghicola eburneus]|jgi:hypothetical protein|nr:hypothetical protein [Donghicola eburneus]MAY34393.1 hypothetical protein [Rhodovulum sp.]MCI5042883.1 hypothetical protein [Donghicola eburneus]|tara:strand:- start:469 stop:879 length:411 start_codon:yes stop_codon:yes gene_type:complete